LYNAVCDALQQKKDPLKFYRKQSEGVPREESFMTKVFKTKWATCVSLIFTVSLTSGMLTGCSSSEMKSEDEEGEEAPSTEAPTDAIPQDTVENAADPNATAPETALGEGEASAPLPDAGTSQAMTAPNISPDTTSYTIQRGDTLMKIAFERYGDLFQWRRIQDLNRDKISDPNRLAVGTVIALESKEGVEVSRNGEKYAIKHGDTLGSISKEVYGSKKKWKRLWTNNRQLIQDPNKIFAGFYLYYTMSAEDEQHRIEHKPAPVSQAPKEEAPQAAAPDQAAPAASGDPEAKAPEDDRGPASVHGKKKRMRKPSSMGDAVSGAGSKYPSAVNKWLKKK